MTIERLSVCDNGGRRGLQLGPTANVKLIAKIPHVGHKANVHKRYFAQPFDLSVCYDINQLERVPAFNNLVERPPTLGGNLCFRIRVDSR